MNQINLLSFDTPQRQNFLNNTINCKENDAFLGKGSFGCVFKAVYKERKVAVKVIAKSNEFKFQSLAREKNVLKLRHQNIIKIFKIVETKECGAMIMERFANGKSLQFVLDHLNSTCKLQLVHRLKILKDIANGLRFCHENHIIHRDLKPDNIMIVQETADSFSCKLFDFGCSYKLGKKETKGDCLGSDDCSNFVGTIRFSAPEQLQGCEPNFPVDIYSFGIIMWQLKEKEIPYKSIKSNDIIVWQVVKNNLRPDSTLLLLAEMNERSCLQAIRKANSNLQCCKSDLLGDELRLQVPIMKKSLTPISTNCNQNLSRTDRFRQTATKSPCIRHGNGISIKKNFARKKLFEKFDCKSIDDFLVNIENIDNNENIWSESFLHLFTSNKTDHQSSLYQSENEYIKLYKACWHENPDKRPTIQELFCLLNTFTK